MTNKPTSGTWTKQRLFDPIGVQKSTITKWEWLKLLFRRNQYAYEPPILLRYKRMGGKTYILDKRELWNDK